MFLDWFTATGFVAAVAVAVLLMIVCRKSGCSSPSK